MSETNFTKGEWVAYINKVNLNHGYAAVECEDRRIYGQKVYKSNEIEETANAHLIAAAPEMYAMLESFLCLEGLIKTDKIQALLTKARGEI
tara:strand:+ start:11359 stop:11631 length:273 start_codon:yes stop_codon:yes gene_type:complete